MTTRQELKRMEDGLNALSETALPGEPWQDKHDAAMRCRDFEQGISDSLPLVDQLLPAVEELAGRVAAGASFDLDSLHETKRLCAVFAVVHQGIREKVAEHEGSGFRVAGAVEMERTAEGPGDRPRAYRRSAFSFLRHDPLPPPRAPGSRRPVRGRSRPGLRARPDPLGLGSDEPIAARDAHPAEGSFRPLRPSWSPTSTPPRTSTESRPRSLCPVPAFSSNPGWSTTGRSAHRSPGGSGNEHV